MSFFNSLKLLFPFGKAWTSDKNTAAYKFTKGISALPDDVRHETDKVYMNLFPETTEALEEWENSLLFSLLLNSTVKTEKEFWPHCGKAMRVVRVLSIFRNVYRKCVLKFLLLKMCL